MNYDSLDEVSFAGTMTDRPHRGKDAFGNPLISIRLRGRDPFGQASYVEAFAYGAILRAVQDSASKGDILFIRGFIRSRRGLVRERPTVTNVIIVTKVEVLGKKPLDLNVFDIGRTIQQFEIDTDLYPIDALGLKAEKEATEDDIPIEHDDADVDNREEK